MARHLVEPGSEAAAIIVEEEAILGRVLALVGRARVGDAARRADYDADLVELRDEIAEAKPEDLAPLVEQMTRIASLAAGRSLRAQAPIDAASPYFAHLRLREGDHKIKDVLVGRRGLIDRHAGVQIVDWRDAPISQIYYRYEEGDDYDEAAPGDRGVRRLEGVIEARRNVSIQGGRLRRIGCPQGTFVSDGDGRWWALDAAAAPTLQGGSGKAARPPAPSPRRSGNRSGGLGAGAAARADKHLPEIAALIDRHQFALITEPGSGLVVIQGGAGSGKTTVALHRVAYLTFHDARRFRAGRCLVVVPSPALERYVAGVLPALGVRGVPVVVARAFLGSLRRRVLPHSPHQYNDEAPSSVTRVKKHPALLGALARWAFDRAEATRLELAALPGAGALLEAWLQAADRPLLQRLAAVRRAATGEQRLELAVRRLRRGAGDVLSAWAELLTDGQRLRAALPSNGDRAVTAGEIEETVRWVSAQLDPSAEEELRGVDPEARAPIDGGSLDDSERGRAAGRMDPEDDALLLRLAQILNGDLAPPNGEAIRYDHIAVDEAQDLSATEIKVLLDLAGDGPVAKRSVTLAGDVAQRLVLDNAFSSWGELLADVGARGEVPVRPLHLSYRSTEQVMAFAREVLGSLPALGVRPDELVESEGERAPPPARQGADVELHRFADTGEAVGFLAEALRSLAGREPTASVALIVRHPQQADAWHVALRRAEVGRLRRVARQDFSFSAGIDITDVAQVKGLEFDYVVLLDVTASSYPATVEARHLLHIGATRAAHQLWLIAVGDPSPLLPASLLREGDA